MDNYSSMANSLSQLTNDPAQLIDSVNRNREFTKSALMMTGQTSLGGTGAAFVGKLKDRYGDTLKKNLNISEEEMSDISGDVTSGDYTSALTKITNKLGSKLTSKGRGLLSDLKEKSTNLKENPTAETPTSTEEAPAEEDSLDTDAPEEDSLDTADEPDSLAPETALDEPQYAPGELGPEPDLLQADPEPKPSTGPADEDQPLEETGEQTGETLTDDVATQGAKVASDLTEAVGDASLSLDFDPFTLLPGLALGLAGLFIGKKLKANKEVWQTNPNISSYAVNLDG